MREIVLLRLGSGNTIEIRRVISDKTIKYNHERVAVEWSKELGCWFGVFGVPKMKTDIWIFEMTDNENYIKLIKTIKRKIHSYWGTPFVVYKGDEHYVKFDKYFDNYILILPKNYGGK